MLESVKIQRRQSEIRQALTALVGKATPEEAEVRQMADLDAEFQRNEVRYRASLIAEDQERRDAGKDLETRGDREWSALVDRFELRQVALAHDEGAALSGPTQEVVGELRNRGGFKGIPIPWQAFSLERRAGETVAANVPDPTRHHEIIGQLFPTSLSRRLGGEVITIDHGTEAFPILTQGCQVGWQATELGNVGAAQAAQTSDRSLKPDYTLGCQMILSRRSLKQAGQGLELAVRRDASSAMAAAMDDVVFNGLGASGQPAGLIAQAAGYGIDVEDGAATWASYRDQVVAFLAANAANDPMGVRLGITPANWGALDEAAYDSGSGLSQLDKLIKMLGAPVVSSVLPIGTSIMTTSIGGVSPYIVGLYGAVDSVRDVYTLASAGSTVLTFLATMDVSALRAAQIRVLEDVS